MELAIWLFHGLQLVCALFCCGIFVFQLLAGEASDEWIVRWRHSLALTALWFAIALLVLGVGVAAAQLALVSGRPESILEPAQWARLLLRTRFGAVWILREGLALLLIALLAVRMWVVRRFGWRALCAGAVGLIAPFLAVAAFAGHGATTELGWVGLFAHASHYLTVGGWLGGLLPLALLLSNGSREYESSRASFIASALQRFSRWAAASMAIIVVTGVFISYLQVQSFPALLGTAYGWLLLCKLGLIAGIFAIASSLRWRVLPQFADRKTALLATIMKRTVMVELGIAVAIVAVASAMSGTTPAAHDDVLWLFPFRFSIAATWEASATLRTTIGWCAAFTTACGLWVALIWRSKSRRPIRFAVAGTGFVAGLAWTLSQLAVPAYPDTYRTTPVLYQAVSVAKGIQLFIENCTQCHGTGGRGDGPLAAKLPRRPANLTEPHTALHTVGDMYWWLTNGIPASGMPALADRLTEEGRWDVINFQRAFSEGFQARLLRPSIVANEPWLGAPDFSFVDDEGNAGTLKDYRGKRAVLLVFFSWPEARQRLEQLAEQYGRISAQPAQVIAVPWVADGDMVKLANASRKTPFPVVANGAKDIVDTYMLFRRTLGNAGREVLEPPPPHMEFLIDRYGYMRARWIPEMNGDQTGWQDIEFLLGQIAALNREEQLRPSPDEHVH